MSTIINAVIGINFVRESNQHDKNEYTLDAQEEANAANAARDGVPIKYTFREKWSGVDLWAMPKLTELRQILQGPTECANLAPAKHAASTKKNVEPIRESAQVTFPLFPRAWRTSSKLTKAAQPTADERSD